MEQFNLKMTLRHQNIDNTITSFVLCYIIFVNQSKLDRIRYTFQKTASVNDIPVYYRIVVEFFFCTSIVCIFEEKLKKETGNRPVK